MSIDLILKSLNDYDDATFPPVHLWNPPLCENTSFSIDIKGDWYYNGSIIGRQRLKKLFSTVIKKEQDDYFLVTPIEKIKIDVEIAPYIINDFEYDSVKKEIIFHTNFDYSFPLNNDHELTLKTYKGKEYPVVKVRSSIEGLINRSVFYKLIDIGINQNNNNEGKDLVIKSFDSLHRLGKLS